MDLPWKKEVKESKQEVLPKKKLAEKPSGFEVAPVLEVSEKATEQASDLSEESGLPQAAEKLGETVSQATVVNTPVIQPVVKDEVTKEIEDILSEDLTDVFLKMNPEQQEEFRLKGEETASKIRLVLTSAKVNVKKILILIGDWLKMIPGVNRFFLEQEAKIKTDKILLNSEEFKKEGKL